MPAAGCDSNRIDVDIGNLSCVMIPHWQSLHRQSQCRPGRLSRIVSIGRAPAADAKQRLLRGKCQEEQQTGSNCGNIKSGLVRPNRRRTAGVAVFVMVGLISVSVDSHGNGFLAEQRDIVVSNPGDARHDDDTIAARACKPKCLWQTVAARSEFGPDKLLVYDGQSGIWRRYQIRAQFASERAQQRDFGLGELDSSAQSPKAGYLLSPCKRV